MKLVIDIDEETYKRICKVQNTFDLWDLYGEKVVCAISSIRKGLPYEERPQGKWIETGYETGALGITYRQTQCSNCGWEHALPMWWNFCPECGADMRGEKK